MVNCGCHGNHFRRLYMSPRVNNHTYYYPVQYYNTLNFIVIA